MNARNNQKHTRIGIEMARKLFEEGKRVFTIADARKAASSCGMADSYVVEALYHLSNTGWLTRLKRGLYVISSSFPGMTPAHEFEIAMALVQPSFGSAFCYQPLVCSAFSWYDRTNTAKSIYYYNTGSSNIKGSEDAEYKSKEF